MGARQALEAYEEFEEEAYLQAYEDGAKDALYYIGKESRPREKTSFKHGEDGNDDEEYEEIQYCPQCDCDLEYDEGEDLFYCPDERCGWEEG